MSEFEDCSVLVVGLGSSGQAAAKVLAGMGARVVAIDSSRTPAAAPEAGAMEACGIEVRLGQEVPGDLDVFDLVVASPGVPDGARVMRESRAAGLAVISELELGYRLLEGNEIVAVTGTNGKTTTTRMIAEMLDRPRRRAVPCGNIGTPLVSLYGQVGPADVLVCEVSSFQLQNIERFHAAVAVVLNLAPDHFDWHGGMDDYAAAKMRIIENMTPGETVVYNLDDGFCRDVAARANGRTVGFGLGRNEESAVWLREGWIVTGPPLTSVDLVKLDDLMIEGPHNVENTMAAAAASLVIGEEPDRIRRAAVSFEGLEHRCEPVGEVGGVAFYNDSKATNPHATLRALRSFEGPFSVIMGGRNKGLDFTGLAREACSLCAEGRLRGVVLIGESAGELETAFKAACREFEGLPVVRADDIDGAVEAARRMAPGGGAVLFSPACASFDMFDDYKDRGRAFKSAVGRLAGGDSCGGIL